MVGFGAELIETIINNHRELRRSQGSDEDEDEDKPIQRRDANVIKVCTLVVDGMTCSNC